MSSASSASSSAGRRRVPTMGRKGRSGSTASRPSSSSPLSSSASASAAALAAKRFCSMSRLVGSHRHLNTDESKVCAVCAVTPLTTDPSSLGSKTPPPNPPPNPAPPPPLRHRRTSLGRSGTAAVPYLGRGELVVE